MVEADIQTLTSKQFEQLQRQYLWARFCGDEPIITDNTLESDGRKRGRVVKEAVSRGLLVPANQSPWDGKTFQITSEVIASVVPASVALFEQWTTLHEQNRHREAFERPWIRVDEQPIECQVAFLSTDDIDWFVVSRTPYEFEAQFTDAPETIRTDDARSRSFNGYWAGPFVTLKEASERRKTISRSCVAASSISLRKLVADYFVERKIQRLFAKNLLWGLAELGVVPQEVLFDADCKPTVDGQLDEGHSIQFASNPNIPTGRQSVEWESNLAKSIERLESRIAKAQQKLDLLRVIETRIGSNGGWESFMNTLEQRLRTEVIADDPA